MEPARACPPTHYESVSDSPASGWRGNDRLRTCHIGPRPARDPSDDRREPDRPGGAAAAAGRGPRPMLRLRRSRAEASWLGRPNGGRDRRRSLPGLDRHPRVSPVGRRAARDRGQDRDRRLRSHSPDGWLVRPLEPGGGELIRLAAATDRSGAHRPGDGRYRCSAHRQRRPHQERHAGRCARPRPVDRRRGNSTTAAVPRPHRPTQPPANLAAAGATRRPTNAGAVSRLPGCRGATRLSPR